MKHIAIASIFVIMPLNAFAHGDEPHLYDHVHTDQLKKMVDSKEVVIILDARTSDRDDGNRLPGAHSLPYNIDEKEIIALIPSKDTKIIVYCGNEKCSSSGFLAERLATLGYKRIYKYSEGLKDWIKKDYPIEQAQ